MRKKQFFLFFFSNFFRILSEKFFRLSAEKLQEVVKTTFCVSRGTLCDFNFFLKRFELFWIFCRNLWHGSQTSIFVSRVKIAEKTDFFLFFFQNFFEFWAKFFSDFRPKNFKKFSKLPTCPEEKFVTWFFLSFQTFRIFCRNSWHGSQNSIYVSRVKIAEKTVFFLFSFQIFFEFWAKTFQTFGQKTSKKFSKLPTCPEE